MGTEGGELQEINTSTIDLSCQPGCVRAPFAITRVVISRKTRRIVITGLDTWVAMGTLDQGVGDKKFFEGARIYDLTLSPDGSQLACAASSEDGLFIVDTSTEEQKFRRHTDQVSAVAFSHDGVHIAAGDWDGGVYVYRDPDWKCVSKGSAHRRMVGSVMFSADGQYIITGGGRDDPSIRIWELKTGTLVREIQGS